MPNVMSKCLLWVKDVGHWMGSAGCWEPQWIFMGVLAADAFAWGTGCNVPAWAGKPKRGTVRRPSQPFGGSVRWLGPRRA